MRYLLFIKLFICPLFLSAQKHDYQWFMGYQGGSQSSQTDKWGIMHFNFNQQNKPSFTEIFDTEMNFSGTNTSLCDSAGQLICYSNGLRIYDHQHQLIENGNNLVLPDQLLGNTYPQGALLLPTPGYNNRYTMFSIEKHPVELVFGWNFFYHTIERTANNTLKVIQKRKLIVQDTLSYGILSAVKHANGRDWWLLMPNENSPVIHRVLLSPYGIQSDTIMADISINTGVGQAIFSPDGSKYIIATDNRSDHPADIYIHDFDRCTGELSNGITKQVNSPGADFGAVCARSPDGRYLYVIHTAVVFQYDLTAPDIFATETLVGQYDGFGSGIYGSYFMFGQTGADGRIYISSWVGTFHMHQVDFPHRQGTECSLKNHSIQSPVYLTHGIPSFPHFRLGSVDGSPCDTLGIDNHPLCNWRWETEDTLSPLTITFTDLSTYQPENWLWDFGDGSTSTERYPMHTYDSMGIYEVCLIVSNQFSVDTFCMTLPLGVVSSSDELASFQQHIRVTPNPFYSDLSITLDAMLRQPVFRLFDIAGRLVAERPLAFGTSHIPTDELAKGMYFWQVISAGEVVQVGKAVKI